MDVEANHHPEPNSGHIGRGVHQQDGRNNRHHHHSNFDEVQKETEHEDHHHNDDELGPEPTRKACEEFPNKFLTAKRAEGRCQHRGTQEDDEHKRSRLRGVYHHALHCVFDLEGSPGAPNKRNDETGDRHHR